MWEALCPQKSPRFSARTVRALSPTRSSWLHTTENTRHSCSWLPVRTAARTGTIVLCESMNRCVSTRSSSRLSTNCPSCCFDERPQTLSSSHRSPFTKWENEKQHRGTSARLALKFPRNVRESHTARSVQAHRDRYATGLVLDV